MNPILRTAVSIIDHIYVLMFASVFAGKAFDIKKMILFLPIMLSGYEFIIFNYGEKIYENTQLTLCFCIFYIVIYSVVISKLFGARILRVIAGISTYSIIDGFGCILAISVFFPIYKSNFIEALSSSILFQTIYCSIIELTDLLGLIVFYMLFIKNNKGISSYTKYDLVVALSGLCMACAVTINAAIVQNSKLNAIEIYLMAITAFFFIVMNILFFLFVSRLGVREEELAFQEMYNKSLNGIINKLSEFKHNFDNIIASISGYIEFREHKKLLRFMKELKKRHTTVGAENILMLKKLKEPGIMGLILGQMEKMKAGCIHCSIVVDEDIEIKDIKISDLCDCLGILIDNAVEAASGINHGFVKIRVRRAESFLIFVVENTVQNPISIDRIFEKGWSTKGDGRGLGLWYIMNIVDSYKNVFLNTSLKDNVLCQELMIDQCDKHI